MQIIEDVNEGVEEVNNQSEDVEDGVPGKLQLWQQEQGAQCERLCGNLVFRQVI